MVFVKKVLALLFINWLFVLTLQAPCTKKKLKPKKALKRLRRTYFLVDKFHLEIEDNGDSAQDNVGKLCPFKLVTEDALSSGITQIPSLITKAACPNCKHYCKPVHYSIRVLQKKGCDKRTGDEKWIQVEKRIPVAYIFNSS